MLGMLRPTIIRSKATVSLAGYAIATDVHVQLGSLRPTLHLHHGDADEHPLVIDQRQGISIARAQEITERISHTAL